MPGLTRVYTLQDVMIELHQAVYDALSPDNPSEVIDQVLTPATGTETVHIGEAAAFATASASQNWDSAVWNAFTWG